MIRRVLAGVGITAFDKLVIAGTQLALVPLLVTQWGVAQYGQWLLLATIPQFLNISDFGFATAAGTRMTMAIAHDDRDEAVCLFQSAWRVILVIGAAAVGVVIGAVFLVPDAIFANAQAPLQPELRVTAAILACYGVLAVQGSIFSAGFRAAQQFPRGAMCNAGTQLIENAALVAVVLMGGGMVAAASAWFFGRLIGLMCQHWQLRKWVPWLSIGVSQGSWREVRALLRPAGSVMLLPLSQTIVLQGTALVVGGVAGSVAVPAFVATRTISRIGIQLCWIVSTPLMPEFSAAIARGDRGAIDVMITASLIFSALVVVPFALGFMVCGQAAIGLWTNGAIVPDQVLIVAMGLTIIFGGIWYPLSNLILAANRQSSYTGWYFLLSIAAVTLSAGLVVLFGSLGAAVSMALLDGVMLIVVVTLIRTAFPMCFDWRRAISLLLGVFRGLAVRK